MEASQEVKKYMSSLNKKGTAGRAKFWEKFTKSERSDIMRQRRLKGIANKSQFLISKNADYLEGEGYQGGILIKE